MKAPIRPYDRRILQLLVDHPGGLIAAGAQYRYRELHPMAPCPSLREIVAVLMRLERGFAARRASVRADRQASLWLPSHGAEARLEELRREHEARRGGDV